MRIALCIVAVTLATGMLLGFTAVDIVSHSLVIHLLGR